MPEGDTVWRSATNLHSVLAGRALTRCDIRVPAFATVDLTGRIVDEVVARGKHILMRIGDVTLHSHLKMEGSWHIYRAGSRWYRPEWQARAILANEAYTTVGFQLGRFEAIGRSAEDGAVGHLGPDLLGPDWNADTALANLTADPTREIGLALLDQRIMAGIGNVYRAELCFLRGVLPTRAVGDVAEPEKLIELAQRLLAANRDRAERTTTGALRGQRLWVYGRAGQPCLRCGTTILAGELGDDELMLRQTWWCAGCQR